MVTFHSLVKLTIMEVSIIKTIVLINFIPSFHLAFDMVFAPGGKLLKQGV